MRIMQYEKRRGWHVERAKMENVTIVLNRPKYPGNIGSIARCAKNMGIPRMIVVNPLNPDRAVIEQLSTHFALDIVDTIQYSDNLKEALSPFHYVVGTTGRSGDTSLKRSMVSPRTMAGTVVDISHNNTVALVFGPEDRGLTNAELKFCDLLVKIPTSDHLKSINLSHAAMIICYEIFVASSEPRTAFTQKLATVAETEAMYDHLKEVFLRIGFIKTQNPDYWMTNVRRLFSRTTLLAKDVKIIRGICHQVELYGRKKIVNADSGEDQKKA